LFAIAFSKRGATKDFRCLHCAISF